MPKTFLNALEWIDSTPECCCEKNIPSDTLEKLMTAQDSCIMVHILYLEHVIFHII